MRTRVFLWLWCMTLLGSASARAARLTISDQAFVEVKVFLQTHAQARQELAGFTSDFYLRRARLVVFGAMSSRLSFFAGTDSPNFGKGGKFDGGAYIQDAFVTFKAMPELVLDAGLMILPLSHHTLQGSVALNMLDYHSALVRYPPGSTKGSRDIGVQLRGFIAGRASYRVAATAGVRTQRGRVSEAGAPLPDLNPSGVPRGTAQLRYDFFDPETDFFLSGTYLGKKRVLSAGVGLDLQPSAVATGAEVSAARAVSADLFLDYPLANDHELIVQGNLARSDQGALAVGSGWAYFVELGYRMGVWGPVAAYERFDHSAGSASYQAVRAGVNWWVDGHVLNLKLELALERDQAAQKAPTLDAARDLLVGTLQLQLWY